MWFRTYQVFDLLQLAKTQRLIPQAMAFLKKQQAVVFEEFGGCDCLWRQPPGRGQRKHESVFEKDLRFDLRMLDRQSQEQRIQPAYDKSSIK